jgi:hypothetical protein
MAADVQTLLRMPFDLFWAHVLFDPSVKTVRAFWMMSALYGASAYPGEAPSSFVLSRMCLSSNGKPPTLPVFTRAIRNIRVP